MKNGKWIALGVIIGYYIGQNYHLEFGWQKKGK